MYQIPILTLIVNEHTSMPWGNCLLDIAKMKVVIHGYTLHIYSITKDLKSGLHMLQLISWFGIFPLQVYINNMYKPKPMPSRPTFEVFVLKC